MNKLGNKLWNKSGDKLGIKLVDLLKEILSKEMNKQLIVYMPLMILCMLKIKELKEMLKEMMVFFVLQLLEIVLLIGNTGKTLNISILNHYSPVFQFSVSGPGFSVFAPESANFNSPYRASGSLKMKK